MKPAFTFIPADENAGSLHMVIEQGWYGVSFAWYKNDPLSHEGILSFNFNEKISTEQAGHHLKNILETETIFNNQFRSVSIFYNFKESLLVPGKYHSDMYSNRQLNLMYGNVPDSLLKTDFINYDPGIANTEQIYNIYRVPEAIDRILIEKFPSASFMHSTSMQLQHNNAADIYCIIFHNTIKLILFNRDQLQLVQQFHYVTPEDVVYHLLNTCEKYNVAVNEAVLMLSGMIDAESNLYYELYKYFLNISFEPVSDEVFLSADIKSFPSHFFSHLTALAQCVL